MSVSLVNILDERVNGVDTRLLDLEKLTKDLHGAVQKHQAKGSLDKVLNERIDTLSTDNVKF